MSLKELGLISDNADAGGRADRGDAFSMAAAYAFERVLKAVGDDMSTPFKDLTFPDPVPAILRDSRGRFGDDC